MNIVKPTCLERPALVIFFALLFHNGRSDVI